MTWCWDKQPKDHFTLLRLRPLLVARHGNDGALHNDMQGGVAQAHQARDSGVNQVAARPHANTSSKVAGISCSLSCLAHAVTKGPVVNLGSGVHLGQK